MSDKFKEAYNKFCDTAGGVLARYVEVEELQHSIGAVILSVQDFQISRI